MNMLQILEQSAYGQRSSIFSNNQDKHLSSSDMLQKIIAYKNEARRADQVAVSK